MDEKARDILDRMCSPRALAVYGGVTKPGSFAHFIVMSLLEYGYPGRIVCVAPNPGPVPGTDLVAVQSLDHVDAPVDLASISVPAEAVPGVIGECVKNKVAGAQVHTSGFAEAGTPEGLRLQEEIQKAAQGRLRIVGPNCFGIQCPAGRISMLPSFDFSKTPGPVALISQSGGLANDFGHEATRFGVNLSKVISFGNGCDLDAVELLDYLGGDPETRFIGGYLEGIRDGRKFLKVLDDVSRKKPCVVWKAGLTPIGSRAAGSHTGSLGGEKRIWEGALKQSGAIPVQGLDPMMDTLAALHFTEKPVRKVALMGGGGAIGVFSSDLAHELGMEVPEFSGETQKRLQSFFRTPGNSVKNPLDTGTPALGRDIIEACTGEILQNEPVDALILIFLLHPLEVVYHTFMKRMGLPPSAGGAYFEGFAPILKGLARETGKEVLVVLENRACRLEDVPVETVFREVSSAFQEAGIAVYPNVERALRGLKNASLARSFQY